MRLNAPVKNTETTHEGAQAAKINSLQRLRRSVLACLLWEKGFYEDGEEIAQRIMDTARQVKPHDLAALAIEARTQYKLRHVPLLLCSILCQTGRGSSLVSDTIEKVIRRADELTELLAIYAKVNGVTPDNVKSKLSAQLKIGLAKAFPKFDEYQLAKYNREGAIKLRDALFLCHAKPMSNEQDRLWKRLIADDLKTPDTWEVALSAGDNPKETFERLLKEEKLGYLALLRNLRNMSDANCDPEIVKAAVIARKGAEKVLPFRYVSAARAVPKWEPFIDDALMAAIEEGPEFVEPTIILVDVSGSMDVRLSDKSELSRIDAAATLASIIRGNVRVFTFSDKVLEAPPRRGMAGVDAIKKSQPHMNTYLATAIEEINKLPHERLIVITDEQAHREYSYLTGRTKPIPKPAAKHPYMINVGVYKNGVGYGNWTHIDGFSEQVLRYILESEKVPQ